MSLLIPPEMARHINKYSGLFNSNSQYAKFTLKRLFHSDENLRYLAHNLHRLIINQTYIKMTLESVTSNENTDMGGNLSEQPFDYPIASTKDCLFGNMDKKMIMQKTNALMDAFSDPRSRKYLFDNIQEMVEVQPLPHMEDLLVSNTIQQLHSLNREFMMKSARNIIMSPEMIVAGFNSWNLETGENEADIEYDYNYESWGHGVWKPEDLFMNSKRNKRNPQWSPLQVSVYSDPDSKGAGHRYYTSTGPTKYADNKIPQKQNLYAATQRTRSQFPRWQRPSENENYERRVGESLREGGMSDRRVQRNHGYNMVNLISKSTY